LDVLHHRCAGLDVHKKTVVACIRWVGPDGVVARSTRTFATTTAALLELADWLAAEGVRHLAMESTGVYWKPVWHLLEGRFELMLVNARHIKQVPGRKTDVKDAEWIAQLLQHGLLAPSFVPPPPVRELRDLTRQRAQLVADRCGVANRVQKVLEAANIKLASVASDVLGASGRAMIARIIGGETDPDRLAAEARGPLRKKVIPLRAALEGRVTDHHRFQLRLLMDQLGQLDGLIARLDARIAEVMAAPEKGEGQEPRSPLGRGDRGRDRRRHGAVPDGGPPGLVGRPVPGQRSERRQEAERQDDQGERLAESMSRKGVLALGYEHTHALPDRPDRARMGSGLPIRPRT
jgi:transposase